MRVLGTVMTKPDKRVQTHCTVVVGASYYIKCR